MILLISCNNADTLSQNNSTNNSKESLSFNNSLSTIENKVLNEVKMLRFNMNDPNSFTIYDDILYIEYEDSKSSTTDTSGTYTFVDCGAANSYGGMVRETFVIYNGKIIGKLSDIDRYSAEIDDLFRKSRDNNNSEEEKKKFSEQAYNLAIEISPLIKANVLYASYLLAGSETTDFKLCKIVSKDKIVNSLD